MLFALDLKLLSASGFALFALLADASVEAKSWEDLTLKAALTIALIVVSRLLIKEQAERKAELIKEQAERKAERELMWAAHKAEIQAAHAAHKAENQAIQAAYRAEAEEREEKLRTCIEGVSKGITENCALTREQTDYFRSMIRTVFEERIKKPQLP